MTFFLIFIELSLSPLIQRPWVSGEGCKPAAPPRMQHLWLFDWNGHPAPSTDPPVAIDILHGQVGFRQQLGEGVDIGS
jgi:hypothetical protein